MALITEGIIMKMLTDLLTTDYGLMSLIGILMMIVGSGWSYVVVKRKMNEKPAPPPGTPM